MYPRYTIQLLEEAHVLCVVCVHLLCFAAVLCEFSDSGICPLFFPFPFFFLSFVTGLTVNVLIGILDFGIVGIGLANGRVSVAI